MKAQPAREATQLFDSEAAFTSAVGVHVAVDLPFCDRTSDPIRAGYLTFRTGPLVEGLKVAHLGISPGFSELVVTRPGPSNFDISIESKAVRAFGFTLFSWSDPPQAGESTFAVRLFLGDDHVDTIDFVAASSGATFFGVKAAAFDRVEIRETSGGPGETDCEFFGPFYLSTGGAVVLRRHEPVKVIVDNQDSDEMQVAYLTSRYREGGGRLVPEDEEGPSGEVHQVRLRLISRTGGGTVGTESRYHRFVIGADVRELVQPGQYVAELTYQEGPSEWIKAVGRFAEVTSPP